MALDPVKNFIKVTASTGYDSAAVTVVLLSGQGSNLPLPSIDGSFNLVWWNSSDYNDPADDPNVEIVRVVARIADTLTVNRGQEGTSATVKNIAGKTYKIVLGPTAKTITDIDGKINSLTTSNIGEGSNLYFTNGRAISALTGQNISIFSNNAGYLTANQSITLSGDISGTGSTTITTTIGASKVTNTMLAGSIADSKISSASTWNAKQNAITTGTTAQYLRGDLSLATFPTNLSSFTNGPGYITANQTITLSGILAGSGTTSITVSAATGYYMPSTSDQTSWNAKQPALSGTGFVKISGTTISYDNSSYIPYTGATSDVDLGTHTLASGSITSTGILGITVASGYAGTFMGGKVGIGTTTPTTELEVSSTSTAFPRGIMSSQYTTDNMGARLDMRKARGTRASPTTVVTGDTLGKLVGSGYDGASYLEMACIEFVVTDTVAGSRIPTQINFYTATNASTSVLTNRMNLDSSGNLNLGTGIVIAGGSNIIYSSTFSAGLGKFDTITNTQGSPVTLYMNNRNFNAIPTGAATTFNSGTYSATSGNSIAALFSPTMSITSTGGYTALSVNAIETSFSGSGTSYLLNLAVTGGSNAGTKFNVLNTGNVGIGTATPNANALLDITSTTKAFMPPRMTTTQKNTIASPTGSMIVFDTTLNKLCVYGAASWETVTSV